MGSGPPLLMFPAFLGGSPIEAFRRIGPVRTLSEGLAQLRRLLLFDNRGTGNSPPPLPTSAQDLIVDTLAVADGSGTTSFSLMCTGFYAPVALEIALTRPDRVSSLALIGPALRYADHPPPAVTDPLTELAQRDWALYARTVMSWFDLPDEDRTAAVDVIVETGSPEVRAALHEIEVKLGPPENLEALDVPTLVLQSVGDDTLVPSDLVRQAAAAIPGVQLATLDGSLTRLVNWLEPIRRFLREVEPVDGGLAEEPALDEVVSVTLSLREVEVLRLVARGMSNAQVADVPLLVPWTLR